MDRSKLELNALLLKKEMKDAIKTGKDINDIVVSKNRIYRKCFKCGNRFTTFKKKNFVLCKDCGKTKEID